ncbi:hypothetical protein QN352_21190, partial [Mucilaginibacter sp. 10I4]|nr:hypothetical protein [Mucilaginibacter sp. 10I4]
DVYKRQDADTLALKPTVLSIHIGVNDFWHTLGGGYTGTIETYTVSYTHLRAHETRGRML